MTKSRTSFHDPMVSPLMCVIGMFSPMPTRLSAIGGNRNSSTTPNVVVGSSARPTVTANTKYTIQANAKFIVTPAQRTMIRAHSGLFSNSLSGGYCSASSPPSRPAIASSCSSRLAIFT